MNVVLTNPQFQNLFELFNEAVYNKEFHKLTYPKWKFYHQLSNDRTISISYKDPDDAFVVMVYHSLDGANHYDDCCTYESKDFSFGSFLSLHYKEMLYKVYPPLLAEEADKKIISNTIQPAPTLISTYDNLVSSCNLGVEDFNDKLASLQEQVDNIKAENMKVKEMAMDTENACVNVEVKERKENKMRFNFDFGPVKNEAVRMSPYGMAIRNADGIFVAFDKTKESIVDVDVFNFNGSRFIYKMPVALKDVAEGDVVIHNHVPMFVTNVNGNSLEVVDIYHGEKKSIIPAVNMFGFNFVTKVVSFIDMGTPSNDNPFGNIAPFLMMDGENDMENYFMASMMMNQNGTNNLAGMNPMMMTMFLMKDKENEEDNADNHRDYLPLMMAMMMNSMTPQTPAVSE